MKIDSIRFEGVDFAYEGQDPLFEAVDFNFPMDQFTWVKSSSGLGRSSLLQLMASLQMPTHGSMFINEQNVTQMSFEEFLPYRLQIGYGFDFGGLINNRTLFENLMLPLVYHKLCPQQQAFERAYTMFDTLGVVKFMDKRPALVPGGVRKLTCLMRSLITHPQLLLLDDPSVGVGQETILKFFDMVLELRKQGVARHVFISSFDEKMMGLLPHTQIFIDAGQIHKELDSEDKKVAS
jgi:phospholipid/cholesterol/gamma-HCH transport system ATP-binding protein